MAWPPPTLPITRTNATPQHDTHAGDHNAANLAINDTVGEVQALGDRVSDIEGRPMRAAKFFFTTNVGGGSRVTFSVPFAVEPTVVMTPASVTVFNEIVTVYTVDVAGADFVLHNPDGTPVASSARIIEYFATLSG